MPTSRLMKLSDGVSLGVMSMLSSAVTAEARSQHTQGINAIMDMVVEPTSPEKSIQIW